MFTTRLISGIILVLLAVLFVGKGGLILFGVTALFHLWAFLSCIVFWGLKIVR